MNAAAACRIRVEIQLVLTDRRLATREHVAFLVNEVVRVTAERDAAIATAADRLLDAAAVQQKECVTWPDQRGS